MRYPQERKEVVLRKMMPPRAGRHAGMSRAPFATTACGRGERGSHHLQNKAA